MVFVSIHGICLISHMASSIYVYICIDIHMYIYTYIYIHMHTYMSKYTVFVSIRNGPQLNRYRYVYICIDVHTDIYIYIHVCIYI